MAAWFVGAGIVAPIRLAMVATGHALRPRSWSPIASALGESLPTSSGAANDPPKRDGPGRDQATSGSPKARCQ
jgi:hypothetical protein